MMKQWQTWLTLLALFGILVFAWLTRFYQLATPAAFVFDERYHVPAVRLIAEHDPRAFEWWHGPIYGLSNHDWLHPPLAKYLQAWFFNMFGQTAFSWRLPSAISGVIGIALTALVAYWLFDKKRIALLAALLLSLDGLWLVQSRVAMNDILVSVWLLAAMAVYLWYRRMNRAEWLLLVGLFGGLGLATKWSAVFWLAGLLVWEVLPNLQPKLFKKLPWLIFTLVVVPVGIYVASYTPMFLQGKSLGYLIELHKNIARYELLMPSSHPDQSTPWQWLLNLKPVTYWQNGDNQQIVAVNNPLLVWFEVGAVIFAGGVLWRTRRKQTKPGLDFLLTMFVVSFLPWVASPRLVFYYHFTPAVPLAAILLAYWFYAMYLKSPQRFLRLALFVILTCLVWSFWLTYPRWVGLPILLS